MPHPLQHWKGALQFALPLAALIALGYAVDPIAEHFRQSRPSTTWQRFRPPHETSTLVRQGTLLWGGGRDGLCLFDWSRRIALPLPPGTPRLEQVRSLMLDRQGVLWAAHLAGVERHQQGKWSRTPSPVGPATVLADSRTGQFWLGGEAGLARWDGKAFRSVRDNAAFGFQGVDALLEDRAGQLWAGSAHPVHGGAARLSSTGDWLDLTASGQLRHTSVNSFHEDRQGAVWLATGFGKQGAATRFLAGGWSHLTKADGLAADRVRLVFEDSTARLWVSSEVDGTAVRQPDKWRVYTPQDGLTGWEVKCIVETPDGGLWLATEDGVTRAAGAFEKGATP